MVRLRIKCHLLGEAELIRPRSERTNRDWLDRAVVQAKTGNAAAAAEERSRVARQCSERAAQIEGIASLAPGQRGAE